MSAAPVRAAAAADAEAVAELWNRMIRDTLATFNSREKTVAEVGELIAQRPGAFFVAEEGRLDGFVTFAQFRAGPGYAHTIEHTILLDEAARGRGIGLALMRAAVTAAEAAGHHVMVAGISSANPAAVTFHERLGFRKVGHMPQVGFKANQWLDLILMQKILAAS
ncbi:GNAT family N-acetyltransferase [Sulfitobacter aestuarii]|uniref:GNAT family N-acetyltransferase n=1 Tax=Sulfitobacter aestuarii TaxID=2161676 RepID=A0ABW5U1U7_9RHOB